MVFFQTCNKTHSAYLPVVVHTLIKLLPLFRTFRHILRQDTHTVNRLTANKIASTPLSSVCTYK